MYETEDAIPDGVIADAFYAKGHGNVKGLLRIISEMTNAAAARGAENPAPESRIN